MLDISRLVVPPFPGVFSSFGLLVANVEHHFVQTYFKTFEQLDLAEFSGIMERLWNEGRSQLHIEGFDGSAQEITTQVDMKYVGQVSELSVSMPTERITPQTLI